MQVRARFKVDSKVGELAKVGLLPLPRSSHVTAIYSRSENQNDVLNHGPKQDKWIALDKENLSALSTVERVLRDLKEDPIVRHEAAEQSRRWRVYQH